MKLGRRTEWRLFWLPGVLEFHIYRYNVKITSPNEKSVTSKNFSDKISVNFCLNVMRA